MMNAVHTAVAQGGYRVNARYGGSYRFQSSEVWNIEIQYAGSKQVNAYLKATIADLRGRKLVELTSGTFMLQPGSNSLSSATTDSRLLQYYLNGLAELEQASGSLPSGSYTICYTAYCSTPDCDGAGTGALYNEFPECIQLTVEPPTPLLLAWPEDGAETDSRRPAFSWIPPMPLAQVPGFSYTYSLYTAQQGQTCNEAALMNPPLYRTGGIEQPSMAYPPELDDLDTGKSYCWKVDGMLSDVQVAQSEVWKLKVRVEKDTLPGCRIYKLSQHVGNEAYSSKMGDTIQLVFSNEVIPEGQSLKLQDENTGLYIGSNVVLRKYGTVSSKHYYLVLSEYWNLKPSGTYLIMVDGTDGNTYKVRLKIRQ